VCVRLEVDGSMAELDLQLMLAAGIFWRGSSLATTAQFLGVSFGSSPNLWQWCSVLSCALLVCVFVDGVHFARYV
jgi:hypothetical protein